MARPYGLSKSKLMEFLQCPRRLWLSVHAPERGATDGAQRTVMAVGHAVGAVARQRHPDGRMIAPEVPLTQALEDTRCALEAEPRVPLFEATVQADGVLARADLLLPKGRSWTLVEVKSSTSVKDHYYQDVAIQAHVFQAAGVPVTRVALQHINAAFVYPGDGCYHEVRRGGRVNSLFVEADLTGEVAALSSSVPQWIKAARRTLGGPMPPETDHCEDPYPCPFIDHCHGDGPEFPLQCLPNLRAPRLQALAAEGYADLREIPAGVLTNPTHERVRVATVSKKPSLLPGARAILQALPYPRYYLDFETIQFAVPIWKGTRPYEQLPFQWSCHIESKDGNIGHQAFLDLTGRDPTRPFAEALLATLKSRGPILVYNQGFEGRIIRELATRYPDLSERMEALLPRLVDLLPITRAHYYHPAMKGSWSIKAVLPTIAPELDYGTLDEVQDGGGAQQAYLEAIDPGTPAARRQVLETALLRYCGRDTEAMVRLAAFLAQSTP